MKICVLSSGSKGNSTLITTSKTKILIDLGTTTSYVEKALEELDIKAEEIDAVFISHIHSDHIKGLKTFIKRYNPQIYVTEKLLELLREEVGEFNYKLYEDKKAVVEDLEINIIKTSHDAGESVGFIVTNEDKSMVHITDTGFINSKYHKQLSNKNLYVFESNHDIKMLREGPYPYYLQQRVMGDKGHLSNNQSSKYLCEFIGNNTKKIIFAHISEHNNSEEKVLETFEKELEKNDKKFNNVIVAKQNKCTEYMEV